MARTATLRIAGPTAYLRTPNVQLLIAALTIAALFGGLLVAALPIWSAQPSKPPAVGAPASEPVGWIGLIVPAALIVALCVPFRPYLQAQRLAGQRTISPRVLLAATALIALSALLIFPGYGSDIFDYVGFERMWVVYGDNPLLALPLNHPGDWSTAYVWYPDRTPAYGPLWALLTWPIVRLAGDSLALEVAGYKALSLLAYAACCWLIWISTDRARRTSALIGFAWSPLVLFEVLGKVHNDLLGALPLLAAVWLLGRRGPAPWRLGTTGASVTVSRSRAITQSDALNASNALNQSHSFNASRGDSHASRGDSHASRSDFNECRSDSNLSRAFSETPVVNQSQSHALNESSAFNQGLGRVLAPAAVVAGALVKVTALAALPPVAVYLWRRAGLRTTLPALGLASILAIALYAPFWEGARTLAPIWNQTSRVVWSPLSLLMVASTWLPGGPWFPGGPWLPGGPYATALRAFLGALWLAVCAGLVLRRRLEEPRHVAEASAWILLASILLLTSAVFAHYFVPAVALAAVSANERLGRVVTWLSIGGLAAYAVELLSLVFGSVWIGSDAYRVLGTLTLLGPVALMLLAQRAARRPLPR